MNTIKTIRGIGLKSCQIQLKVNPTAKEIKKQAESVKGVKDFASI